MSKCNPKTKQPVLGYAKGTPFVKGKGTETSDSIPAKLSKGEAVLPASVVKHYGKSFVKKLIDSVPADKGAVTKVKDGVIHAAAGIDPDALDRINNTTGVNRTVRPSIPLPADQANAQIAAKQAASIPEVVTTDPVKIPQGKVAEAINNTTGVNRPPSSRPMSKEAADFTAEINRKPNLPNDYVTPESSIPNYQASSPKTFGGAALGLVSNDIARQVQGNDLVQEGYTSAKSNLEQQFGKKLPALPGQMTSGTESTIEALPSRLADDFMAGSKGIGGAIGGKVYDIINPVGDNKPANTTSTTKPSIVAVDGQAANPAPEIGGAKAAVPDAITGDTQPQYNDTVINRPKRMVGAVANERVSVPASTEYRTDLGGGNYIGDSKQRSPESVARMREITKNAMAIPAGDQRLQPMAAPATQPIQLGQQRQIIQPSAPDYSGDIQALMEQIPRSTRDDSLGEMIAKKNTRKDILAKIGSLSKIQEEANQQYSLGAKLAADNDQFQQRMLADANQSDSRNAIDTQRLSLGQQNLAEERNYQRSKDSEARDYNARKLAADEIKYIAPSTDFNGNPVPGYTLNIRTGEQKQLGGNEKQPVAIPQGATRDSLIREAEDVIKRNPHNKALVEAQLAQVLKQFPGK